jgi:hypothetical protein
MVFGLLLELFPPPPPFGAKTIGQIGGLNVGDFGPSRVALLLAVSSVVFRPKKCLEKKKYFEPYISQMSFESNCSGNRNGMCRKVEGLVCWYC